MAASSAASCRADARLHMRWGFRRKNKAEEFPTAKSRVKLGGLKVSPMGIGTWAWGNKLVWGYDEAMDEELQSAFNLCIDQGINWFDSADSYGTGKIVGQSERLLGKFIREYPGKPSVRDDIRIATKFAPYPTRLGAESIIQACEETLERLQRPVLDVGQLHWAPPLGWQETRYWQGLAELVLAGQVREVGLSNYGPQRLGQAHHFLLRRGAPLASNQVQFSLLSRYPLYNGLFEATKDLGVTNIAYSPLALGLLTGKYNPWNVPSGPRGLLFRQLLPSMGPLLGVMGAIAGEREKTMAQVAINWTIAKGTVPIVGVKSVAQARENLGALGWLLTNAEVEELDRVARLVKDQTVQNIFQSK